MGTWHVKVRPSSERVRMPSFYFDEDEASTVPSSSNLVNSPSAYLRKPDQPNRQNGPLRVDVFLV